MNFNNYNNVINYAYIDYIIKLYVPKLQIDTKYKFIKMDIFKEAMLHTSTKFDETDKSYERLEYLGDAIFHLIITEYFYRRYEDENEGFLTRLRIRIEKGDSMAELAKKLQLEKYIQINDININDHILEDIFEAFIGAFYLNFGIKYTKIFVISLVEKYKNLSELIFYDDNYKDLLLRYFHQMKWGHPVYIEQNVTEEKNIKQIYDVSKKNLNKILVNQKRFSEGNLRKQKNFFIIVRNPYGKKIGSGTASTKKRAEQLASENALKKLGLINNGEIDPDWANKIEKIEKESKEKDKIEKKTMSIFNSNNILIKLKDIKKILLDYNIIIPKDINIDIKLFREAMTHRSYLIRKNTINTNTKSKNVVGLQKKSNERLQFLGDAVIHFVIADFLYHKYPNADEGFLTRLRCKLENRESLFFLATKTNIGKYLLVSKNIEILHGRNNINIIGGGFESFIGSLYLEIGLNLVHQFILGIIRMELDINKISENETNYKELILQLYHKNHWGRPKYSIIKEGGPDHCKIFTIGIYLNDKLMGKGSAYSKKKAEQIASKEMYLKFVS